MPAEAPEHPSEVPAQLGMAPEVIDVAGGERTFTKRDVAILRSPVGLTERGLLGPDLSLGAAADRRFELRSLGERPPRCVS